jgi:hypothetical protein
MAFRGKLRTVQPSVAHAEICASYREREAKFFFLAEAEI